MRNARLLHQENPGTSRWFRPLIIGVIVLPFIIGLPFCFIETTFFWAMLGLTVFDGLLILSVIPRRFEIYEDRLRIRLGGPFAMNLPLASIKDIKPGSSADTWAYSGLRLVTSGTNAVEIIRRKGMDMIITPADSAVFIEELKKAIQLHARPDTL